MSESTPYSELKIEMQPMNPPRPVGFGVFKDGKLLAFLTLEEVKKGLLEYEAMEDRYQRRWDEH